ncbi:MAG TPA: hypothetical protein VM285_15685 [Polyangia bacterium]|nr:hypothetical protein [Polyangia bacterium]
MGLAATRKALAPLLAAGVALAAPVAVALDLSENPERSLLIGIELGAALDLDPGSRHPEERLPPGGSPEAYAISGFSFGLFAAFRFNEVFGVQGGWNQSRHRASGEWGAAHYQLGHLALRLAVPTPTRQTPVLLLGPAIGSFSFGLSTPGMEQDNTALAVGGLAGLVLEHELGTNVVATLGVTYTPLFRFGQGGILELYLLDEDGTEEPLSRKDFGDGGMVHLLWIELGLQFEWLLR